MLQIGIIGMGRIGRVHALCASAAAEVHIRAVSDSFVTPELETWATDHRIDTIYQDYREILNDEGIDAVLICTPTPTHAALSLEAIEAGKHVFCEKPVALTLSEIREVERALIGRKLIYQVGFNQRLDSSHAAVREAVAGELGQLYTLRITSRDPAPPPIEYIENSGGIYMDMMIHDFDLARFVSGSEVKWVWACGECMANPEIGRVGDVDTALVTLRMENGALVSIENTRNCAYGYDQRVEAFGEFGMAISENHPANSTLISTRVGMRRANPIGFFLERYRETYTREIERFFRSILYGDPVNAGLNDALQNARIAVAAERSRREERRVWLHEIEE